MTPTPAPTSDGGRRLVEAMESGEDLDIALALVAAVYEEPDRAWLYDRCLDVAKRGSWKLAATAATCIGNLARLRGYFRDDMIPVLESLAAEEPRLQSQVEDAIENVQVALEHPQPEDVHE